MRYGGDSILSTNESLNTKGDKGVDKTESEGIFLDYLRFVCFHFLNSKQRVFLMFAVLLSRLAVVWSIMGHGDILPTLGNNE